MDRCVVALVDDVRHGGRVCMATSVAVLKECEYVTDTENKRAGKLHLSDHTPEESARRVLSTPPPERIQELWRREAARTRKMGHRMEGSPKSRDTAWGRCVMCAAELVIGRDEEGKLTVIKRPEKPCPHS
jgi:hypothetical protein